MIITNLIEFLLQFQLLLCILFTLSPSSGIPCSCFSIPRGSSRRSATRAFTTSTTSIFTSTQHNAQTANNNRNEPTISSDRVLSPEYFKSVYQQNQEDNDEESKTNATPWDIGGGRPQPDIVSTYEEGKLRGRIIDAGCGKGENCIYLAGKYGISSVVGFDLAPGAIEVAMNRVSRIEGGTQRKGTNDNNNTGDNDGISYDDDDDISLKTPFWTTPQFLVASCTDIVDRYNELIISSSKSRENNIDADTNTNTNSNTNSLFDISIDSGLLHCLSDEDAIKYVTQMAQLIKPITGRAYVGCFSTANPDPWDNPRRLSEDNLRDLFCVENGWEVISIEDTWWARPPLRGSSQGAFSMALWMEARRLPS